MKVNAVVLDRIPKTGIDRYHEELLPVLSKYVDVRITRTRSKEIKVFSRPIGGHLSLLMQRRNIYRENGEIVHSFEPLPFSSSNVDIMNVYGMIPWKFLHLYQPTFLKSLGYAGALQAIQTVPKIIVMSQSVKRDIIQMCGRKPEAITVIPGGVNSEKFRFLNLAKMERTILAVGVDNPRKNLCKLVEGIALLKNPPTLVWAGGKNWLDERKSVVELAARLRIPLTELGYISDEELVRWYNVANLLVYPSLDEGGGLPPLEAMACGTLTAVSDIPPLREELKDTAVYFDPNSPESIARGIQDGLAAVVDGNILRKYAQNFRWDLTARRIVQVYKEVYNGMGN